MTPLSNQSNRADNWFGRSIGSRRAQDPAKAVGRPGNLSRWWLRQCTECNHHLLNLADIMGCYIYCFCAVPAPEIRQVVGMEDSRIRVIDHNGISAVTSDCSERPAASAQNVVAHHRVVNAILGFTTPVPCRFGMVLSRRDLEVYVEANGPALKSLLERFRGCVEMSLRVTWNSEGATSQLEEEVQAQSVRMLSRSGGPGTRFLAEKVREAARRQVANRRAQAVLDWADGLFGEVVRDRVARLSPEAALVGDVAHLVERQRLEHYRRLFRSAASERTDLGLSISGPWAPYSFSVVDEANNS